MATSAVVQFMARKRKKDHHLDFDVPNPKAAIRRENAETPSPLKENDLDSTESKENKAAKRLQSTWRGYLLRKEISHLLCEAKISGRSVQTVLDLVLDWYEGWISQSVIIFLLLFYLVTVCYQIFGNTPNAYSTESSVMKRVERVNRDNILQSTDMYAVMKEYISVLGENYNRAKYPLCDEVASITCPLNRERFLKEYNNSFYDLVLNLTLACPDISVNSGYLDASQRIVGTVYVAQTRRKPKECLPKMQQVDPYQGVGRSCLEESLEDNIFESNSTQNCPNCGSFVINPQYQAYLFALTGNAFNVPMDFVRCRVDELERRGWLDYRTKRVCFFVTLVDLTLSGRMAAFKECFQFELGGSVTHEQSLHSFSYNAAYDGAIVALTITSLVLTSLCELVLLLQCRDRRHLAWRHFLLHSFASLLCLAANIMYLIHCNTIANFSYNEIMTIQVFFFNTFVFLESNFSIFTIATYWETYTILASLGLLVLLCDSLASLDFHPSTAIVSGILKHAAARLLSFSYVFFLFMLVYAFIGMILFPQLLSFASFGRAVNTLLLFTIGEIQELELYISNPSNTQYLIQYMYFWFYALVGTILLMNVLLAIIVGAFVELTDFSKSGGPMLSLSRTLFESVIFLSRGMYVRSKRVFETCFKRWCRKQKKMGDDIDEVERNGGSSFSKRNMSDNSLKKSPSEMLLSLRQRFRVEGCSPIILRKELLQVFYSPRSVELVLLRARLLTQQEQFKAKEMFLRGFEPSSAALKGHSLSILESLQNGQHVLLQNQIVLQSLFLRIVKSSEEEEAISLVQKEL